MENFIKKCEDWINNYEQSQNMVSRRDLQLKYYRLREDYESLGDICLNCDRGIYSNFSGNLEFENLTEIALKQEIKSVLLWK